MTQPITGVHAGRRQVVAFALFALVLFCLSCEMKRATAPPPARDHHNFAEARLQAPSGGGGGGTHSGFLNYADASPGVVQASSGNPDTLSTRKIIRNGSLELLVGDIGQSVTKIGSIVTGVGGYVEKSTQSNSGGRSASLTVRVPAARLDEVMTEVKGLATTVDRENVEVRDVTREYIDLDAHLRNAQAEEAQYLQILKRATTIKDTLEVTEKLSDVRGRIDEMQGEMKFLTSQIDMSSLEISLRAESDATVAGFHWRPLRQAKIAAEEMVSGLADWADAVISFFINLPLIAVWLVSVVILLLVAFRVLRFLWRRFGPKTSWRLPWRRGAKPQDKAVP